MIELLRWALNGLLEHVETGRITLPLLVIIAVLVIPTLWGVYVRYFLLRKVENLYIARIADKDAEIQRLNQRVVHFERGDRQ